MAYSTSVTVIVVPGGAWPQVTARLWMLWSVVGSGSGTGPQQSDLESVTQQLSTGTFQIAFNGGPDNSVYSRSIGLSLQDPGLVATDRGWWFRSGSFDTLPAESIEIVIGSPTVIPAADLPTLLPSPPFAVDSDTTVTSITASLAAGGIDFTATGTTSKTGVIVAFTFAGRIVLSPSAHIAGAETHALTVGIANPTLTFAPGPSVLSAVEAAILNALSGFILRDVAPPVRAGIERRVNAAVLSAVGRSLPGGTLPAGVILSVRNVTVTAAGITALGAIGAFGGIFNKFPAGSTTGKCFIATTIYGADSDEVRVLRAFRDRRMLRSRIGRRGIALYETVSPAIATHLASRPRLRQAVRAAVMSPAVWLARRRLGDRSR